MGRLETFPGHREIYYKRAKLSFATGSQAHFDQILDGEKATLNISEGIE